MPPKLQVNFKPKTINETGDTSLVCNVTAANPPADIKAYDPFNNTILLHNGTARITNVTSNFSGSFSCIAYNGIGPPVTKYAELIVHCKFSIWIETHALNSGGFTGVSEGMASEPMLHSGKKGPYRITTTAKYRIGNINLGQIKAFCTRFRCL